MKRKEIKRSSGSSSLIDSDLSNLPPINLSLNGMSIKFDNEWKIENEEFDKAAVAIEKVLTERDSLLVNLHEANAQIIALKNEITDLNATNKAALDLVRILSN
jgi:hypothetical protein